MNEVPQVDTRQAGESPTSIHLTSVDQIDLLCDAFEEAWLRGESPRIEMYLERCDEPVRQHLLAELLLVERELRIRQGESASRLDYQRRFPEYSTIIDNLEFTTIDERGRRRSEALDSSALPFAGTKLAHFELLEELGSGASGTVWKAKDSRLRRTVAIKIPHQGSLTDSERERFLREGQACAQLQHPNIVAVYEVGEDRGQSFIVAELVDGLNLKDWLKQRQPKPREAAELAAQVAEALHHAHEQGVIHRDLKPANVLMDREGRPHIADFGLAKWSTDTALMTVEGNILGTPAYMSPEQARGDVGQIDRRSDVYGLGALLYEMLTGQPPFEGEIAAIVHQVIHDEPRTPRKIASTVPRDLETICLKAMEKELSRRYPSAQEMAVDVRRFLRGEAIIARRANPLEKSWRWLRRRPAIAAAIAMAIIASSSLALAGRFAEKNHELLGLRMVTFTTDPPNARVALIPLSESTGEPMPDQLISVRGRTPIEQELTPGDYLVVAVLDNGDFHEVFRHVPSADETMPGIYNHQFWEAGDDRIVLPSITILKWNFPKDMVYVGRADAASFGVPGSTLVPVHKRRMAPFYIDKREFTYDDCRKLNHGMLPESVKDKQNSLQDPMPVSFDHALAYAEEMGKRLPTEFEIEYAASKLRPLNSVSSGRDVTATKHIVVTELIQIRDDVGNWTTSWPNPYPPLSSALNRMTLSRGDYRIVRRLSRPIEPSLSNQDADGENQRLPIFKHAENPSIGFRCVRSVRPRVTSTDFWESASAHDEIGDETNAKRAQIIERQRHWSSTAVKTK